jgi:hypothetical protein
MTRVVSSGQRAATHLALRQQRKTAGQPPDSSQLLIAKVVPYQFVDERMNHLRVAPFLDFEFRAAPGAYV